MRWYNELPLLLNNILLLLVLIGLTLLLLL